MKFNFDDALRYFGVLLLTAMLYAGTIITGLAIWPDLLVLWTILSLVGLALLFPFAVWLDRKMMK